VEIFAVKAVFQSLRLQAFSDTLTTSFDIMDNVTNLIGDGEQTDPIG
jgi:hypothetical protein